MSPSIAASKAAVLLVLRNSPRRFVSSTSSTRTTNRPESGSRRTTNPTLPAPSPPEILTASPTRARSAEVASSSESSSEPLPEPLSLLLSLTTIGRPLLAELPCAPPLPSPALDTPAASPASRAAEATGSTTGSLTAVTPLATAAEAPAAPLSRTADRAGEAMAPRPVPGLAAAEPNPAPPVASELSDMEFNHSPHGRKRPDLPLAIATA